MKRWRRRRRSWGVVSFPFSFRGKGYFLCRGSGSKVLITKKVDILCSYAGIVSCMHGLDMDAVTFRRTMDVNATGSFICAQAAAK